VKGESGGEEILNRWISSIDFTLLLRDLRWSGITYFIRSLHSNPYLQNILLVQEERLRWL